MPSDHALARWTNIFVYAATILMIVNLFNIFIFVPNEASMGIIQRIFYFHVPSAFVAFLAFGVTFVYSILFLTKRKMWYDRVAYCSAEIGIIFTTAVLTTGPLWARPVWNTWWTWDARLTSTLVLWYIYIGYMMLRSYTGEEQRGARFAAVFAIIGFIDVPIVYMANRLWRTLHPQPVIFGGSASGLNPTMRYVLIFSMVTFLGLYLFLLFYRLRVERVRLELNEMKREMVYS
jgi:heme exporter protein C